MRYLTGTLVLGSLVLLAAPCAAAAPPPPPPKFWTVSRCERAFLAHDRRLPTADGHGFHVGQLSVSAWADGRRVSWRPTTGLASTRSSACSRVLVTSAASFARSRSPPAAATASSGSCITRGDQYVGWPADFYMSPVSVRLLAPNAIRHSSAPSSPRSQPALRKRRRRAAVWVASRPTRGRGFGAPACRNVPWRITALRFARSSRTERSPDECWPSSQSRPRRDRVRPASASCDIRAARTSWNRGTSSSFRPAPPDHTSCGRRRVPARIAMFSSITAVVPSPTRDSDMILGADSLAGGSS